MKIDIAKRRRVMERSRRLGHCICNVQRPCPCDVLREQNLCPCAGERPEPVDLAQVKLTDLVRNAGCASKIAPADLDAALGRLPEVKDPAVISGLAAGDDAAIYRIADDLCLVQTVDVFTPCVDDPRLFGRICAVNCLSDIYAMGGEPRTALSILAFPSEKLPGEIMHQLLAGAMEIFEEAGVALVGGHSVKDDEIKLGFAITGLIDPAVAAGLEKPNVGDALVLTKPLGTGVLAFGRQIGRGHPSGLAAAETSMATLNKAAAEAMKEAGASACTDVTGFGLFAHLLRMLRLPAPSRQAGQGKLTAEVFADALPAFDGVMDAFRQGVIPGAVERNREYVGDAIRVAPNVEEALVNLGFDAQTSGGLLIAIRAERLETLRQSLTRRGVRGFVIGRIVGLSDGQILVTASSSDAPGIRAEKPVVHQSESKSMNPSKSNPVSGHDDCCADSFRGEAAPSSVSETQRAFGAMMRATQAAGALSEKAKELILFSLVVHSRCSSCFDAHFRKAREMGITQAELDEAAWCAIAMGGAPVKMFYQESLERVKPVD
ncbi:MAG: selenide, water dikinase SelD [Verrucomicrobia bacterium]|nr:selenide, water dikinase SelD [Verrucomicrobiota bacterium]